ncbi:uncharacterized protein K460DRAFT_245744, partial [Cucurbitaria berberidis CBS 394.84]
EVHPEWKPENGVGEEYKEDADEGASSDSEHEGVDAYQGRVNNVEARNAPKEDRPKEIEKHWRSLYHLVKFWWGMHGKDLNKDQQATINKIQDKIRDECRKYAEIELKEPIILQQIVQSLLQKYRFPDSALHGQIAAMSTMLGEIEEMEKDPPDSEDAELIAHYETTLKDKKKKLLNGFAVFPEKLKEYNIPVQAIMSDYAKTTFDTITNQSKESQATYKDAVAEITKPTKDQEEIWAVAARNMYEVYMITTESDMLTTDNEQEIKALMDALTKQDNQIQQSNTSNGVPAGTNCLPLSLLHQLTDGWENNKQKELRITAGDFDKYLKRQPLANNLAKSLEVDSQSEVEQLLGPYVSKQPKAIEPNPKPSPHSQVISNTRNGANPPAVTTGNSANSSSPTNSVNPPSPTPGNRANASATLESLLAALDGDDTLEMFNYEDGMTEFGSLVATRPCRTGNVRFDRHIVNSGTSKYPWHNMVRGSELCPGGAEALSQLEGKDTIFDLRAEKKRIKENPSYAKVKTGPAAIVQLNGPKGRREMYTKVEYPDGRVQWPSRTEYSQLVGKKCADRYFELMEARWKKLSAYMCECRREKVHPDTGLALEEKDRQLLPWFFLGD